jgi:hypothetical protein
VPRPFSDLPYGGKSLWAILVFHLHDSLIPPSETPNSNSIYFGQLDRPLEIQGWRLSQHNIVANVEEEVELYVDFVAWES